MASAEAKDNLTKAFEFVDFKSRMWQATLYENRKMAVTVEDFNPKFSRNDPGTPKRVVLLIIKKSLNFFYILK